MSYGVWRYRGKGWSAIEIDSPWNYDFWDLDRCDPARAKYLVNATGSCYGDNPHLAQWSLSQDRKGRSFQDYPTGGEHSLSVAYDDEDAQKRAEERLKEIIYWKKYNEQKSLAVY